MVVEPGQQIFSLGTNLDLLQMRVKCEVVTIKQSRIHVPCCKGWLGGHKGGVGLMVALPCPSLRTRPGAANGAQLLHSAKEE